MSKKTRRAKAESEVVKNVILNRGKVPSDAVIPEGAVAGDITRQDARYRPRQYYIDRPFKCVDCGSDEVWKAEQQKWYYEVVKGSTYAEPTRCRPCRLKFRATKGGRRADDQSKGS
jgi:hypothetical protein